MNYLNKVVIILTAIDPKLSLTKLSAIGLLGFIFFCVNGCNQTANRQNVKAGNEQKTKYQIPHSINEEHAEIRHELENAVKSGGATGEAAKAVAERLHSHFEKEEEYALPPLGLLSQLANGEVSADMKETIELSDKLKTELPKMLDEHKTIVAALDRLAEAAGSENKSNVIEFTHKLKMHARNEEEVLYPAAILVGEYLKLRLKN